MTGMRRSWWDAALTRVADAAHCTGQQGGRLADYDFPCCSLDPAPAARWPAVWRQEEAVSGKSGFPRRLVGPGVRRESCANRHRVGRRLSERLEKGQALMSDIGSGEVESAFWKTANRRGAPPRI